jgi:hypothetical protein
MQAPTTDPVFVNTTSATENIGENKETALELTQAVVKSSFRSDAKILSLEANGGQLRPP